MMKNKPISLFLCIAAAFILSEPGFASSSGDSLKYLQNPNYNYEIALYKIYKKKRANIVMLGNSITHGVNWNELLGRDDIIERGIPSDNLQGFLARLDYVYSLKPKICFIMGGINDIYNWTPLEQIFQNYVQLIDSLRSRKITVVVQSTLYVAQRYQSSADRNTQVVKLNTMLSDYCKMKNMIFIDLNERLSRRNFLRDDVTYDGLHLNANGYQLWGQEVERILLKATP